MNMTDFNPHIYILSYNSKDVATFNTLNRFGNQINTSIIVGTDDPILEHYKKKYRDNLLIFDKDTIEVDLMNNFEEKKFPIFAREYAYQHAMENNITHYVLLEDDYTLFGIRYVENGKLKGQSINITDWFIFLLKLTDSFKGKIQIGISQSGDYIGGKDNAMFTKGYRLKLMNSYFINCKYPIHFKGSINDDVNTAILLPTQNGAIPVTIGRILLNQKDTQSNGTALQDIYLKYSTYTKSMYSVMLNPSAVKIFTLSTAHPRLHHHVSANKVYPKLLDPKYKK